MSVPPQTSAQSWTQSLDESVSHCPQLSKVAKPPQTCAQSWTQVVLSLSGLSSQTLQLSKLEFPPQTCAQSWTQVVLSLSGLSSQTLQLSKLEFPPQTCAQSWTQSFDASVSQILQLSKVAVPPQTSAQSWIQSLDGSVSHCPQLSQYSNVEINRQFSFDIWPVVINKPLESYSSILSRQIVSVASYTSRVNNILGASPNEIVDGSEPEPLLDPLHKFDSQLNEFK